MEETMKYKKDKRQATATLSTQQSLDKWKEMLINPPQFIKSDNGLSTLASGQKEIEKFIQDKINKAEKCLANLKAKYIPPVI